MAQFPSQQAMFLITRPHPAPYIACDQRLLKAGFCLFCFHLNWLLPTGPTVGAQLLDPEETRRFLIP